MGRPKVSIIGAGRVGSTTTQILAYRDICDIVLVNRTAEIAEGIALDLEESAPLEGFDTKILGTGKYSEMKGSEIVVLTAGAQRKGGQSREELLAVNAKIVSQACKQIKRYAPDCKLIIMTNPLDSMVYLAKKVTGFPKQRVIGQAGILDSSRFREFVAMELKASVKDISAVVLGGHGDFMVPLPNHTTVSGTPITQLIPRAKIEKMIKRTRDAGAEIIKLEATSAFYAPASALVLMIESILKDRKETVPCAAYLDGEYGIKGIFMGVPVVLGAKGIEKIVELKLDKKESNAVKISANKIRESVKQLKV